MTNEINFKDYKVAITTFEQNYEKPWKKMNSTLWQRDVWLTEKQSVLVVNLCNIKPK